MQKKMPKNKPEGRAGQSQESQWVGILVLGFGVLAVLAVGLLAFDRTQNGQGDVPPSQAQMKQDDVVGGRSSPHHSNNLSGSLKDIRDNPVKEDRKERFGKASERNIKGVWEAKMRDGKAILELKSSKYRMIVAPDNVYADRYYSNGTYEILRTGELVLTPDTSSQPPDDGYTYYQVYKGKMPVSVGRRDEYMVWTRPPLSSKVFVPTIHPFLRLAGDNIAVWKML